MATTTTLQVFEKKKFMAKSSNLLLGKKWRMKANLNRGSPNNFIEYALRKGGTLEMFVVKYANI